MRRDVLVPLDQADLIAWPQVRGVGECGGGEEEERQHTRKVTHHGLPPDYEHLWSMVVWRLGGCGLHLSPALNHHPYSGQDCDRCRPRSTPWPACAARAKTPLGASVAYTRAG